MKNHMPKFESSNLLKWKGQTYTKILLLNGSFISNHSGPSAFNKKSHNYWYNFTNWPMESVTNSLQIWPMKRIILRKLWGCSQRANNYVIIEASYQKHYCIRTFQTAKRNFFQRASQSFSKWPRKMCTNKQTDKQNRQTFSYLYK